MKDIVYTNSMISAHMAVHMLDQPRIGAMLRARDFQAAAAILSECDYMVTAGTADQIIESARKNTLEMFFKYCPDRAIAACVTAMYEFSTKKLSGNETLPQAEKKLYDTITKELKNIKYENVKQWFLVYVNAFQNHVKIPESQLFNLAYEMRTDIDGAGLLFYWYVFKQSEFAAVKTILFGRQFNFNRERIMENLRGLYDRFK